MAQFNQSIETQAAQGRVTAPVTSGGIGDSVAALAPAALQAAQVGVGFYQKHKLEEEFSGVSEELKDLDGNLAKIDEAIKSGQSRKNLQMRARTALNSAIAASPMLKDAALEMYNKRFGGGTGNAITGGGVPAGGGAGSFALTPMEQEAQKVAGQVAEMRLIGFTEEQAMGALHSKKAYEIAKVKADHLALQRNEEDWQRNQAWEESVPVIDALSNEASVSFNLNLQKELMDNGGTLPKESITRMSREIDTWQVNMERQARNMLIDKRTGEYLGTPEEVHTMFKSFKDKAIAQKALLKDNSYQKFLADNKDTMTNQAYMIAAEMYPQLALIRELGGDSAVTEFITAKINGNSKYAAWMRAKLGEYQRLAPDQMARSSVYAANKIFGSNDVALTPAEAAAFAEVAATNPQTALMVLKNSVNSPRALTRNIPASLAITTSPKTRSARANPSADVVRNVQDLQAGAISNFNSEFSDQFGYMPSGIEVIVQRPDNASVRKAGKAGKWVPRQAATLFNEKISVNASQGETLSQEMVSTIADLYRSIKDNPKALPEAMQGLTPEQAVSVWINSGMSDMNLVPEPFIQGHFDDNDPYWSRNRQQPTAQPGTSITDRAKAMTK